MKAIEKIYNILINKFNDQKVTTIQIAQAAGLTRGVVSSYLSQLKKEGRVTKTNSRPVFWTVKHPQSSFDQLIGANGSLKLIINHCIEALVYPPSGLPLLIKGEAGTGKRLLAKHFKEAAIEQHLLTANDPLVTINAGDYSNNDFEFTKLFTVPTTAPNLPLTLSTKKIFPTERGILFVKDAQALTIKEQQLLIDLINQTTNNPQTKIRFIVALSDAAPLLEQKIALQAKLPSFHERPFIERLALVIHFLQLEAQKIHREIKIDVQLLEKLTTLKAPGNIEELQNQITLIVARFYTKNQSQKDLFLGDSLQYTLVIKPQAKDLHNEMRILIQNLMGLNPYVNQILEQIISSLKKEQPLSEQRFLVLKLLNLMPITENKQILQLITHDLAHKVVAVLTEKYGLTLPKSLKYWQQCALGLIFIDNYAPNATVQIEFNFKKYLQIKYPRSTYLFEKVLAAIDHHKKIKKEHFLLFFLLMEPLVKRIETIQYNCILLAHGQGIATSMQKVVNSLCKNYIFEAFDMPLAISLTEISRLVKQYLQKQNSQVKGTIILFDMGSLSQIFSEVKKYSQKNLIVINNLSSAMALDIGIRIQRHDTFKTIAQASKHYGQTTDSQYYEGLADQPHIIVSCMSGVGLSNEIKTLFEKALSKNLKIIALDYKHLRTLIENQDQSFFANTILILTTTDLKSNLKLKMMNIYDIFDADSSTQLKHILQEAGETPRNTNLLIDQLLNFFSVEGIKNRLQFLNPNIIIQASQNAVRHYENYYNLHLNYKLKLNLDLHLSLMVERVMMQKHHDQTPFIFPDNNPQIKEFLAISADILKPIEERFNIKINDYEIGLIYEILKDQLPQ